MNMDPAQTEGTNAVRLKISLWGSPEHCDVVPPELTVPAETTVGDLLGYLSTLLNVDLKTGSGDTQTHFLTINNAYCPVPRDLARALEDGDVIAVLPFIAGG